MGMQVKINTDKIFNAYLTLGLLEINKDECNNAPISQSEILDNMDVENISYPNYIGRYLKDIKQWLRDAKLNENEINQLIQRGSNGVKIVDYLPSSIYEDFVGSFLLLNLIQDEQHKNYLSELLNKEGEKPLSIITKLALAKKDKFGLDIVYYNGEEEATYKFFPKRFILENNVWYIEGTQTIPEGEIKLDISKIKRIPNFRIR